MQRAMIADSLRLPHSSLKGTLFTARRPTRKSPYRRGSPILRHLPMSYFQTVFPWKDEKRRIDGRVWTSGRIQSQFGTGEYPRQYLTSKMCKNKSPATYSAYTVNKAIVALWHQHTTTPFDNQVEQKQRCCYGLSTCQVTSKPIGNEDSQVYVGSMVVRWFLWLYDGFSGCLTWLA